MTSKFNRDMFLENVRRRNLIHHTTDEIEPSNRHMKRRLKAKAKKEKKHDIPKGNDPSYS